MARSYKTHDHSPRDEILSAEAHPDQEAENAKSEGAIHLTISGF